MNIVAGRLGESGEPGAQDTFNASLTDHFQELILSSPSTQDSLHALAELTAEFFSTPESPVLCAVTLLRDRKPLCIAFSNEPAHSLEELQYDSGPCLTAARQQITIEIHDLKADGEWREYAQAAEQFGVQSLVAVPLDLGEEGRAALSLYAEQPGRFDADAVAMAESHAGLILKPLRLAVRLAAKDEQFTDLLAAMESRTTIDLAVGIVMGQNRCSQDEAFSILRSASSRSNIKLRELAVRIVESVGETQPRTHFDH